MSQDLYISVWHRKKKLEIKLREKREEVDKLNAELKKPGCDWFAICNKRNAILGDIATIKTKLNNLQNGRPELGYGNPMGSGHFTTKGAV